MKLQKPLAFSIIILLTTSCGSIREKEEALQSERLELVEVKSDLAETNWKIEELNNRFLLLQEKVNANSEILKQIKSGAVQANSNEPNLKVVKLTNRDIDQANTLRTVKLKGEKKSKIKIAESPESLYSTGQDLFIAGKYKQARASFKELAKSHPNHHLADNALYWAGEAYYSEQQYDKALKTFLSVPEKYPEGNKAPDAMLKAAYSYMEVNEQEKALGLLNDIIFKYPESNAVDKAARKLDSINNN